MMLSKVCKISDSKKIRDKARRFEQANVFSSIKVLAKQPKGYDGFIASKKPTCKYGKPFYRVVPYSYEPVYSSGKKVELKTVYHRGSGSEWVKRKPVKRVIEIRKKSDYL